MTVQLSIRLSPDLHKKLTKHVNSIKPETTINKYINYLLERELTLTYGTKDNPEWIEVGTKEHKYITNDGQIIE